MRTSRIVVRRSGGRWIWLILMALIALVSPGAAEVDRAGALVDMREIYSSINTLLPLSVSEATFSSADHREQIRTALAKLAARAEHVGQHVAGGDRRVRFLGTSLSREAQEAKKRFDEGRLESSRFLVRRFTDFCVACHTRIPSDADSPLAERFVSDSTLASLPAAQRASLQVATRRFNDALGTYEALFESLNVQPAELLEPLTEYLRVSIRVKGDLDRPRVALRKFVRRPDLWSNLRSDVEDWLGALDRHVARHSDSPSLATARALLEEANEVARFPADRRGLIQELIASSELHRYLELHSGETGLDVAEAYYLLGLIESRTNYDYLVSEGDFYLETAIRLAPHDRIGREAFDLFEEEAVLGWTGSSGDHMPDDVRRNLESLRKLVATDETPASEGD